MTKGEKGMWNSPWLPLALGLAFAVAGPARADVWDIQTQNDNTVATENELVHGSDQLHDLGALPGPLPDEDWFRMRQRSYSSYEVVADGTSGDIARTLSLDRIAPDGSTVLQASAPIGLGFSRSLRFANVTGAAVTNEYIRVRSGQCTTGCGPDDVYRVRFSETTYAIPRFNNSGGQVTVLMLQNPSDYTISGAVYFWNPPGALIATAPFTLAPRQLLALATQIPAPGVSGSMTIAHDGSYGDLAGRAVSLDPSTGLSFDHPMVPRFR
jgi:hypothetical protein